MLKAILVDDEAPARSELRYLLEQTGQVEVVAEASNVRAGLESLRDLECDVMFLDIKMPGTTGLQLADALARLKKPPIIVFVTAYSEYGARAFDLNAADYLVKPVEPERLNQALQKVKLLVSANENIVQTTRIPVEKGGKKLLIPTDKILYIMAKDDYSYLHTENDRYLSTISLAQLESRFEPYGFFRVHRRYLVNLAYISEVDSVPGGTLMLTLTGEEEQIPVSRRRVTALKKALGI
jgi:two-component system, LytTR family, response regulator LytT